MENVRYRTEKRSMGLNIEEQETHISFMREDKRAEIYTSDTRMITKLNKLIELPGTEWKWERDSKLPNGEVIGRAYSCPVEFISFRKKRSSRVYTEEEKKQIAERLSMNRKT